MANTPYGNPPAPPPSERWNVNMPAVIGVVFVFLLGVIVWVIVSTDGNDQVATDDSTTTSTASTSSTSSTTTTSSVPGTTSPAPMPATSAPTTAPSRAPTTAQPTSPPTVPPTAAPTAPPTAAPTTTRAPTTTTTPAPTTPPTPPTTAAGSEPDAIPGDLGIDGYPMQAPACDDSFITIIASAVGEQATAAGIEIVLEQYPGSEYLRTDQTCPSLNQSVGGEPIYVVYFGPFPFASDACAAREEGTDGAYARQLGDDVPPNHTVDCGDGPTSD